MEKLHNAECGTTLQEEKTINIATGCFH